MSATAKRDAGFMLLEAIVAIVIVSLAFSALCVSIGGAYRAAAKNRNYASSLLLARSQLERAGIENPLQGGTFTGIYPNQARWRMTVTPLDRVDPLDTVPDRSQAFWILLEVLDRRGKRVIGLESAKISGAMP